MAGKSANPIFFNKKRLDVQNTSPHPTVCIRVSPPPPQNHHTPLFCQAPPTLKSTNCPSPPPLLDNFPPYILVFCEPP